MMRVQTSILQLFHCLGILGKVILYTCVRVCVCVKSLSRVRLFVTPRTVAYQAPPSMGFSREEYWSGLPFPSLADHIFSELSTMTIHLGWPYMTWLIVSLS